MEIELIIILMVLLINNYFTSIFFEFKELIVAIIFNLVK